ncbi:MAG: DeoR/GlpR family DNA-binding transcription regulator [Bacillus sp. (in: Bacteria)]|nr:DeoR/GlpR family DNA-binding transcription regulator [Bacillus sp. (in: firmicutes)]
MKILNLLASGGDLRHRSQSFVGHNAIRTLKHYYADIAFVSCSGVDLTRGITDTNEHEAEIRKVMLGHSQYKVLIIDHTKFDKTAFSFIAPLNQIDKIVTNKKLPNKWEEASKQQGITIDDRSHEEIINS